MEKREVIANRGLNDGGFDIVLSIEVGCFILCGASFNNTEHCNQAHKSQCVSKSKSVKSARMNSVQRSYLWPPDHNQIHRGRWADLDFG